ncbi:MAG: 30S ribosomal protein S15 [Methanothrix sp.]|nr:MAG: 30S ribosomal protein S15 [Methanosaeta sp. SDB]MCP1393419.1 30S ribosomal protein S15 [Methanothrix harundinacea]MDD2639004.1 30S ribosomal protein S15 [Methanothrix sp.]MDI9399435.1 30S ribosomal protein S15 [Euryarchaeota archaeon]
MARMHTRRKGSSRSRPPFRSTPPEWCDMSKEELEKHVLRLYGNGVPPTMIGLTLRDQYGVPSVKPILGTKLTRYLKENAEVPEIPEDLANLMRKAIGMRKHLASNKKDHHNRRWLQLTENKIRRLAKYYRGTGRLPENWQYRPETAEMLIT